MQGYTLKDLQFVVAFSEVSRTVLLRYDATPTSIAISGWLTRCQ